MRHELNDLTDSKEKIPFFLASAFELGPGDLLIVQSVFSNLTHLNIGLSSVLEWGSWDPDPSSIPKSFWADFPKALQSLQKLNHLSLDLKIHRHIDQQVECLYFHDDLAELFEDPPLILPRLRTLNLVQFRSCGASVST